MTLAVNGVFPPDSSVNTLPTPRPTIKDVARIANVSQSTVSYILNTARAAERISDQTKQRVWGAVERLGYKFNPIGRALQRGYTDEVTLLMVSWNLANSHAETAMAISRTAARQGLALTVHVADDDLSAEAFIRRSSFHGTGGVLVLWDSSAFAESSLRQIAADGVSVIDLLPGSPEGISMVTADREDAGFRATRHLLELGHGKIGFIGDAVARPKTTLRKLAGYRRALETSGLEYSEDAVQNVTEFGFEGGQLGFQELSRRVPALTAFFCINDAMALGAMDAARDAGHECPEYISVVGFGDSPEGRHWRPKLTTIALSSNRVASSAIELVLANRQQPAAEPHIVLIPEEVIVRDSTARPRRG
jgi:DNA-binding LacI/PurR family transcriptional regulator